MSEPLTPSQTVGPYFTMRLPWPEGPFVVPAGTPGAVTIIGRLFDGAGDVIPDGLIETWQADPDGRFAHPDDPRGPVPAGDGAFRGFGRCQTARDGSFKLVTLKPGAAAVRRRPRRGTAHRRVRVRPRHAGPLRDPRLLPG